MAVKTLRRYYLLKSRDFSRLGLEALQLAFVGKKRDEPGVALPEQFPAYSALIDAGYEAIEDVDGADVTELIECGLSQTQAIAVIAEF